MERGKQMEDRREVGKRRGGEKKKQESEKLKRSLSWLSLKWSPPKRLAPVQGVHKPSVSLTAITVPHYGWLTEINLLNAASNREGGQPSLAGGASVLQLYRVSGRKGSGFSHPPPLLAPKQHNAHSACRGEGNGMAKTDVSDRPGRDASAQLSAHVCFCPTRPRWLDPLSCTKMSAT